MSNTGMLVWAFLCGVLFGTALTGLAYSVMSL